MSFQPTNPPTVEAKVPQEIAADEWQVYKLYIDLTPKKVEKTKVYVQWAWGFLQDPGTEDEEYIPVGFGQWTFVGDDPTTFGSQLLAKIGGPPLTGIPNTYADVQTKTWMLLQEVGDDVETGTDGDTPAENALHSETADFVTNMPKGADAYTIEIGGKFYQVASIVDANNITVEGAEALASGQSSLGFRIFEPKVPYGSIVAG